MGILNSIKQKPDGQKKFMSLIISIFLTLVIVLVWFSFSNNSVVKSNSNKQDKLSEVSPIQVIKDEFSKVFSNLNNSSANLESSSTSPIEVIIEEEVSPTGTNTEVIIEQ